MAHVVCRLVLKLKSKKASGILRTVFSLIIWSERVGWGGWTLSRKKKKERKRKKSKRHVHNRNGNWHTYFVFLLLLLLLLLLPWWHVYVYVYVYVSSTKQRNGRVEDSGQKFNPKMTDEIPFVSPTKQKTRASPWNSWLLKRTQAVDNKTLYRTEHPEK